MELGGTDKDEESNSHWYRCIGLHSSVQYRQGQMGPPAADGVEMRSCLFALFLLCADFSHVICTKHHTEWISGVFL